MFTRVPFSSRGLEEIDLDLDGQGGRTFLRVLLYLCMHDYPPLVTGALQLLFRHFSQRQEVLQAFKQVSEYMNTTTRKHGLKTCATGLRQLVDARDHPVPLQRDE